ncbi:DUF3791 domain-containing protein [uncultured Parabacteroides sp.]|jgi:hypothetical protein|uniref:DUF3791 domain-containing protein n=1 Tax=uncultured Parabacteroides sp. TaxID=512312 RepID=UPI0025F45827|nr:DUF3791 domain-containing protein [uncultured Parabacteroides sp.]
MEDAIQQFIVFCLESYKTSKGISGAEAWKDFEQFDIIPYLTEGFEVLHTQGQDYIIADINDYIHHKQHTK